MGKKLQIILLLCLFWACDTKPLYLYDDVALYFNINTELSIKGLWNNAWADSLRYNWDESIHGKIGYSTPKQANILFYRNDKNDIKKTISINTPEPIGLQLDTKYDAIIFTKTNTTEEMNGYIFSFDKEGGEESTNAFYNGYNTVEQPGEIFSTYIRDIEINDDYSKYGEINKNGKIIHIYNINATLEPISYIYLIEFIIINDDGTDIEAKRIKNFSISGISSKKDLRTEKTYYTSNKQIETSDIKEGQMINNDLVFCSRITMLGLLPIDEGSSWTTNENYLYYTGIDVDTHNYGEVTGIKDITHQLRQNPHGGIITIRIFNSELKKTEENGGNFGINVKDWEKQHIIDIDM